MSDYKEAYEHLQKEYKKLDLSYADMIDERDGLDSQLDFYQQKVATVETVYRTCLCENIKLLQENSRLKIKIKSLDFEIQASLEKEIKILLDKPCSYECRFFCNYDNGDSYCSLFNKLLDYENGRIKECNKNLTVTITKE